ncbi:MAG: TIGR01777 family oxidoreductase [Bacteroidota bacterium]|jgi:uncharacterized protein (TIGR01777 family)
MYRKILITGGTGLIGRHLSKYLKSKGYEVLILGRNENLTGEIPVYKWSIVDNQLDERALVGITDVIHLAGAGIADKAWSSDRKKELIDSRVKSAALIINEIQRNGIRLKSFVGASAIGFYGASTQEKVFNETDEAADDFLGTCCKLWENSYEPMMSSGVRTSIIRVGVVLAKEGGALKKLVAPVKLCLGAALGTGKQIVQWIHIDDLVQIFVKAIEDEKMNGVYNAAAPDKLSNYFLTKAIANVLGKPFFLPNVPSLMLKLTLGEMSCIVLEGSAVSAEKIQRAGYDFKYKKIEAALSELLV